MSELTFRYGVMGCGKTLNLLSVAHNYEQNNMKAIIVKPSIDSRKENKVWTRIGLEKDVDLVIEKNTDVFHTLRNLINKLYEEKVSVACVLVDEAQFLTKEQVDDLLKVAILLKPVIAYGLRLNSFLTDEGFEGATRLLQVAHKIEELKTICSCGRKALFNCRFIDGVLQLEGEAICIDNNSTNVEYKPLCAHCYEKNKKVFTF